MAAVPLLILRLLPPCAALRECTRETPSLRAPGPSPAWTTPARRWGMQPRETLIGPQLPARSQTASAEQELLGRCTPPKSLRRGTRSPCLRCSWTSPSLQTRHARRTACTTRKPSTCLRSRLTRSACLGRRPGKMSYAPPFLPSLLLPLSSPSRTCSSSCTTLSRTLAAWRCTTCARARSCQRPSTSTSGPTRTSSPCPTCLPHPASPTRKPLSSPSSSPSRRQTWTRSWCSK
mmetsp:Transcript_34331/g.86159  ORF Transcript_34331/g.86159 Transcript_34331/m.86159 type:complete len:233 (+) Transcript_34331:174-872(+)